MTAISPELTASTATASPAIAAAVAPAANHGTSDLQAYDLYLRGRYFFEKRGEAGLRRALDYFQQAAEKDSMFARAFAGIANVYAILPLYANVRVDSLMPLALQGDQPIGRTRQHSRRSIRVARESVAGELALARGGARLPTRGGAGRELRGGASVAR